MPKQEKKHHLPINCSIGKISHDSSHSPQAAGKRCLYIYIFYFLILFIVSGKTQNIPDLIHIHIQYDSQLVNGKTVLSVIVCKILYC